MGNITFGSFIAEKRKAHKFNLRDTAKHLNIAYGYLCDIEQSRRPAPTGDFVERISAFLNLDKSEHELLLDLAAKSRNTVSADLPDYIMEKDIVRAALRVAKEVDATDEEWQTFIKWQISGCVDGQGVLYFLWPFYRFARRAGWKDSRDRSHQLPAQSNSLGLVHHFERGQPASRCRLAVLDHRVKAT